MEVILSTIKGNKMKHFGDIRSILHSEITEESSGLMFSLLSEIKKDHSEYYRKEVLPYVKGMFNPVGFIKMDHDHYEIYNDLEINHPYISLTFSEELKIISKEVHDFAESRALVKVFSQRAINLLNNSSINLYLDIVDLYNQANLRFKNLALSLYSRNIVDFTNFSKLNKAAQDSILGFNKSLSLMYSISYELSNLHLVINDASKMDRIKGEMAYTCSAQFIYTGSIKNIDNLTEYIEKDYYQRADYIYLSKDKTKPLDVLNQYIEDLDSDVNKYATVDKQSEKHLQKESILDIIRDKRLETQYHMEDLF